MNRKKGFTIIELLVVLAVLGTIAAFTAHLGKSWTKRASFDSSVKELREHIFNAKIEAASENRFIKFEFEKDTSRGSNGIKYTMWIQNRFVNPWDDDKAWEEMKGKTDVIMSTKYNMLNSKDSLPENFAISPGGNVYKYPIGQTSAPVRVEFTLKLYNDIALPSEYETLFTIHPWGGTKIERKKPAYN